MATQAMMNPVQSNLKVLYSAEEIDCRIKKIAQEISVQFPKDFIVVALLKGSFVFAADLVRALHDTGCKLQVDFMTLSSYGNGTESSGKVEILRDLSTNVNGKEILIIDDILESGNTLNCARDIVKNRGAKRVASAVLLEKPGKSTTGIKADFIGFVIPDHFVVGFGLDYANDYRELPYIAYF